MTTTDVLCGQSGVDQLIEAAFDRAATVTSEVDVSGGRGTFREVVRLDLDGPEPIPKTVVAKLPVANANREAAASSGAYHREVAAYSHLLPLSPITFPKFHAAVTAGPTAAFLLEDLTPLRRVDQLDGLDATDAVAVADALGHFHRSWLGRVDAPGNLPAELGVRRSAVAGFSLDSLARGLDAVRIRWDEVTSREIEAFADMLANAPALIAAFTDAANSDPTLCHGDPRADNLCFAADGTAVLFDWQQIAVQFPEADLAWLAATSLSPGIRRACIDDILECHGSTAGRFRLGLVLPGLAALLLAQREAEHDRARRFIATSLRRIAGAVIDYDVAGAAS